MKPKDVMWTEKYRPKRVDDLVGSFRDKIKSYLNNPESMQHLLLSSKTPGAGKTSLSKVIINELGADALILNSSNDRKIETIREKVNSFVMTKSSTPGLRRIVMMDEADGLTYDAQNALRALMESYASNAMFILTCNVLNKIHDAIQSRCTKIDFTQPDKTEIFNYLKNICENEQLQYDENGLYTIIDKNYPSIRNCVTALQDLYTEGKSVTTETAKEADELYQNIWNLIYQQKDWQSVKDLVFKNNIDVRELNKFIWHKAVQNNHIKLIQVTASNEDKFVRGGDNLVVFVTSLIDMVK